MSPVPSSSPDPGSETTSSEQGEPLVTGILCTYRRSAMALAYLDQLTEQSAPPAITLLVDNGSDPALRAECEARANGGMRIRYLDPGGNLGPAGAFHLGVRELAAEIEPDDVIVHFDDNDPPVHADQLQLLARELQRQVADDDRVGAVGLSGARLSRWTGTVDRPSGEGPVTQVDHLHGWSLPMYRARALMEVGGNDPSFFYGFEELELGRRLCAAGWRLLAADDLMAHLQERYPRRDLSRRQLFHVTDGDAEWSRFHKERNLIRILRREHRWLAIAITLLGRHLAKPLLTAPRHPAAAWRRAVLGLRATAAGLRNAGGIDPRYPPPAAIEVAGSSQ